ncbi:MAG TPA: hypothetical protein VFT47_19355 [Vicinamibacterales bacterium]|nr:hypothetical protein [Vicinamibacterales bacterium]
MPAVPRRLATVFTLIATVVLARSAPIILARPQSDRISIEVDTAAKAGPMTPMWAWFGYDEPNYTYTANGKKLLSALAAASPVPVFVRTHNLLTTGDGTPALKWGSTNAYTEVDGRPRYDWTIVDRIFDTYLERRMKPFVQLGFMPEALSSRPQPYRHFWKPGDNYNDIYTGWSYPPNDYAKWGELAYQLTRHLVQKYGRREVESWWFEVWNEPDIPYWRGTPEEYMKLYDFAADGVKRALPTARIGGPEVTGPNGARTQQFLRDFLEHCLRGKNFATGKVGSPLDLITFHAKGAPQVQKDDGHVRMSVSNQLRAIDNGFRIVASFPELKHLPIVIGESDPEGCAACPMRTNPSNAYRNGTMFSSYTAEQLARTYQLADLHQVNLLGAVTWAFLFEDQPYFDGFRDLATNGIDKPVLNVFRMLGQMRGQRVAVKNPAMLAVEEVRDRSVRGAADIGTLASRDPRSAAVLVWNYHDDDLPGAAAEIDLTISGLPASRATLTHYRIDGDHSNSYARWKAMGSPQPPAPPQIAELERVGQLQTLSPPSPATISAGTARVSFTLPRQGVSLVIVRW